MKIKPTTVADNALDFLIAYAESNRGTITALTERLNRRTGQKIYRQQVESWLAPDPAERTEPKLGIGLLLIHEGALLIYGHGQVAEYRRLLQSGPEEGEKI